jgi:hypothetical protein
MLRGAHPPADRASRRRRSDVLDGLADAAPLAEPVAHGSAAFAAEALLRALSLIRLRRFT